MTAANGVLALLDRWRSWIGKPLEDLGGLVGIDADEVMAGGTYGGLADAAVAFDARRFPGYLFFVDGRLVLVYIGNLDEALPGVSASVLTEHFGPPDAVLRSRAGRGHQQLFFASAGLAASVEGDTVDFLEVLEPMDAEEYQRRIYREPPAFTR